MFNVYGFRVNRQPQLLRLLLHRLRQVVGPSRKVVDEEEGSFLQEFFKGQEVPPVVNLAWSWIFIIWRIISGMDLPLGAVLVVQVPPHTWSVRCFLLFFLLFLRNSFVSFSTSLAKVEDELYESHVLFGFWGHSRDGWPTDLQIVHLWRRGIFPLHFSPGGSPPHKPFPLFQA